MGGREYLGCLAALAVLALISGASLGAVGLLIASKFVVVLVIAGLIGIGVLIVNRGGE